MYCATLLQPSKLLDNSSVRELFPQICVSLLDILVSQDNPPSRNILRLDLISTGCRSQSSAQFLSGDQEPWAFRGGLAGEFQVSI